MIRVGVIGATGYTGMELVRLLHSHPEVQLSVLTSEQRAGEVYSKIFPTYSGLVDLTLEALKPESIASRVDVVFLCLPHHKAMETAKAFLDQGLPVIDLSADFRLSEPKLYETWYGPHRFPELLREAVYGLPELHRDKIRKAKLVANPGCYPTSCILGLAPLIKHQVIALDSIHCDSKSGVSGAGRTLAESNLFCEVQENFKAYKIGEHRHTPEIEQELSQLAGKEVVVSFTPHLVPMDRGILSTLYAKAKAPMDGKTLHGLFAEFYRKEPFIRLSPLGSYPSTQDVRLKNYCDLGVHWDSRTGRIVVISVIDNLTKGASGQAVQNMNLMLGLKETAGLL